MTADVKFIWIENPADDDEVHTPHSEDPRFFLGDLEEFPPLPLAHPSSPSSSAESTRLKLPSLKTDMNYKKALVSTSDRIAKSDSAPEPPKRRGLIRSKSFYKFSEGVKEIGNEISTRTRSFVGDVKSFIRSLSSRGKSHHKRELSHGDKDKTKSKGKENAPKEKRKEKGKGKEKEKEKKQHSHERKESRSDKEVSKTIADEAPLESDQ